MGGQHLRDWHHVHSSAFVCLGVHVLVCGGHGRVAARAVREYGEFTAQGVVHVVHVLIETRILRYRYVALGATGVRCYTIEAAIKPGSIP